VDAIARRDKLLRLKPKLLRGTVIVMSMLGVAAAVLCFVPAVAVYQRSCISGAVDLGTRGPVEHPLGMALYFLVVLAPGMLVWRKPTLERALLWSLLTLLSSIALLVITVVPLDAPHIYTVHRWPAHVFAGIATTFVANLILTLPLGCLGFAIATRKRPPPKPEFPRARVIVR
jgi:hypothetical protein